MSKTNSQTKDAFARYLAMGWPVLPLDGNTRGGKSKTGKEITTQGWQDRSFTIDDMRPDYNVGLHLIGYVDIDLDCNLASRLAPHLLPRTAVAGRESKGPRHYIYKLSDPHNDDIKKLDIRKKYGPDLELRAGYGHQSMIPPSIRYADSPNTPKAQLRPEECTFHDEQVEWYSPPENISTLTWLEAKNHFFVLAAATEFLRLYKMLDGMSGHHEFSLQVAGAMRSFEWPEELAESVFHAVLQAANENDPEDRMKALRSSYSADYRTGIPTLDDTIIRLDPSSKFLELLDHPSLPIKRSLPPKASPAQKAALAAESLDIDIESLDDSDLAALLKQLSPDLARYERSWYQRVAPGDWSRLFDDPIHFAVRVANHLAPLSDALPDKLQKTVMSKVSYCKSTKGASAILRNAQHLFNQVPFQTRHNQLLTRGHVIDLETGHATQVPDTFILEKPIPIDYDPNATCPLWEATIAACMCHNPKRIKAFQQSLGMAMASEGKEEKVIIWLGPKGANGKSTITRVLRKVLGDEKVVQVDKDILTGRAHASAATRLVNSRMATVSEFKNQFNAGMIKQLSGGDTITAHKMYVGPEEIKPTWTVFLMTNEFPHFNKLDDATARRMFVIPWEAQFSGTNRDATLEQRLPSEAAGILNWIIKGYQEWRAAGELEMCAAGQSLLGKSLAEMDTLGEFLAEELVFEAEAKIKPKDLFRHWLDFLQDANIREVWPRHRFYRELEDKTGVTRRKHQGYEYFIGVRALKQNEARPDTEVQDD